MCLETIQEEPEVLDAPLTVYKLIERNNCSLFFQMHYEANKTYHTDMKWHRLGCDNPLEADYWDLRWDLRGVSVSNGFHAYLSRQCAIQELVHWTASVKLVEFVIPKGAKVFRNMNVNKIVADTIIAGDLSSLSTGMGH